MSALLAFLPGYLGVLSVLGIFALGAACLWLMWRLTPPGGRHD